MGIRVLGLKQSGGSGSTKAQWWSLEVSPSSYLWNTSYLMSCAGAGWISGFVSSPDEADKAISNVNVFWDRFMVNLIDIDMNCFCCRFDTIPIGVVRWVIVIDYTQPRSPCNWLTLAYCGFDYLSIIHLVSSSNHNLRDWNVWPFGDDFLNKHSFIPVTLQWGRYNLPRIR